MRGTRTLVLVGVIAYLGFALAELPARQVFGWLAGELPAVAAGNVGGTLWSGHADDLAWRGETVGTVHWRLRPIQLLRGRMEYALTWRGPLGQGRTRAGGSFGGWYLRELHAELAAGPIVRLVAGDPVRVRGALQADIQRVELGDRYPRSASGVVRWNHGELVAPTAMALGSFDLKLQPAKPGVKGTLHDRGDGPLQVQGQVSLTPKGAYRLSAAMDPRGAGGARLGSALQYLGPRDGAGRYHLSLAGTL